MEKVSFERKHKEKNQEYYIKDIIKAVNSLDFFSIKSAIKEAIRANISMIEIVKEGFLKGLEESGEMGLILAAEALEGGTLDMDEQVRRKEIRYSGKVVIGTIEGDIHNLGKNILIALMKSYGINIIDLGIDVSPKKFQEAAELPDVKVVGISFLLSSSEPAVRRAMALLKDEKLTKKVKVILGGAAVSPEIANETKADAYAIDALEGLEIIDSWLKR